MLGDARELLEDRLPRVPPRQDDVPPFLLVNLDRRRDPVLLRLHLVLGERPREGHGLFLRVHVQFLGELGNRLHALLVVVDLVAGVVAVHLLDDLACLGNGMVIRLVHGRESFELLAKVELGVVLRHDTGHFDHLLGVHHGHAHQGHVLVWAEGRNLAGGDRHDELYGPRHGSGHGSGHGPERGPERGPEHGPGRGHEHGPGHGPRRELEHEPRHKLGRALGHGPRHGLGRGSRHELGREPRQELGRAPRHGLGHGPRRELGHELSHELDHGPRHGLGHGFALAELGCCKQRRWLT